MVPYDKVRPPRSFVLRSGRITSAQRRALDTLWPRYGVPAAALTNPRALFSNPSASLTLEIGFGNGENLVDMATTNPDHHFIGIEVYPPGIGRLLHCCAERGLNNVRVVHADAVDAIRYLPPACLHRILVLFPDPWPKRRHHKRRLLKEDFVLQLGQRLEPGGSLHIATDCEAYAKETAAHVQKAFILDSAGADSPFCAAPPWCQVSKFARRACEPIFHIRCTRKS